MIVFDIKDDSINLLKAIANKTPGTTIGPIIERIKETNKIEISIFIPSSKKSHLAKADIDTNPIKYQQTRKMVKFGSMFYSLSKRFARLSAFFDMNWETFL